MSSYFMGIDLARKTDWTVLTVIDDHGNVVGSDRFHQISWSLQTERCALLYRTFNCSKAIADSTGLGDVVIEQLEAQGLTVEPYIFTVPSRKALIEELVLAFDNCEITIPNTPRFAPYRTELESFEYGLDGSTIRYSAPPGVHDDCVMSLALAVHAFRASRSGVLGMILLLERTAKDIAAGIRDRFGELIHRAPKPAPVAAVLQKAAAPAIATWRPPEEKIACPDCGSEATVRLGAPNNQHCNSCACDFDVRNRAVIRRPELVIVGVNCCANPLPQIIPSGTRCGSCGRQTEPVGLVGMSRSEYLSGSWRRR